MGSKPKLPGAIRSPPTAAIRFPWLPTFSIGNSMSISLTACWTADITYVWTLEGWMYLAIVMDLFSRRIVGWAMDKRMKAQLTIDALAMAYWMRKPAKGWFTIPIGAASMPVMSIRTVWMRMA